MDNMNYIDIEMEDGNVMKFETEMFLFKNNHYCLLTPVEKEKFPHAIVMKAATEEDGIILKDIEDEEEYKRVTYYVFIREKLDGTTDLDEEDLYELLTFGELPDKYEKSELDEGMAVISESISGCWKQRFLLNHNTKQAWEWMDKNQKLCTISQEDIDWESLKGLPPIAIERAKELSAHFPTFIRGFHKGVAEVSWQLNPDGRYYADEDGYGMTDDEEITIYGYIDRQGKPVVRFKAIKDWDELDAMQEEAEKIVKKRKNK